jgi:basic amino acid/polyamine antiporter, APA family
MQNKTGEGKPLGFWMCTSLVVGNVIGMGVFMLPASLAPYGLNAFLGWGVTLVGSIFVALTFAHYARALPQEDGLYGYIRRPFGNGAAFFVMWCYWVSTWITNAVLVVGVVGYLVALVPALASARWMAPALALALLWFFVLVNLRGARTSGRVQMATTALKLLPLLAVMMLGIWLLATTPQAYLAHVPVTPLSFEATAAAGTVALFGMLGMECAAIPAGKVDQPERTIPRAIMAGTLLAAVAYIGVSGVPLLLIPQAELAQSSAPFVDLFNRYLGGDAGRWLAVFAIISGLGALNGWTLVVGELTVSFVRHDVFPQAMRRQNRHGAPVLALLVTGMLASAMVLMNYSRSLAEGYTFLSNMVTAATLPLYFIGGFGLIKLIQRGVVLAPGGKPATLVAIAAMAILFSAWAAYGMGSEAMLWALALGAMSMPVFHGMRYLRKGPQAGLVAPQVLDSAGEI